MNVSGTPAQIYARVEDLDKDEFEDLMGDPKTRGPIIDALAHHFAGQYKGSPDTDAVIHLKLWDKPGGGYDHRELILRDGKCTVSENPMEEPRLTLKIRPVDLRSIVTGETGPKRLAMRRRLGVEGDIGFGMKLSDLFGI
jgi:putative sterol carrier protein